VLAPKADVLAPNADVLAPNADVLAPNADVLSPTSDVLAPKANMLSPTADVLAPNADTLALKASPPKEEAIEDKIGYLLLLIFFCMPFWLVYMEIYGADFLTPLFVIYISKHHH
jgi:hypothetical protein